MDAPHPYHRPDLDAEDDQASHAAIARDLGRLLRAGDVVVDVGANRGQFALEVLGICADVSIYSFEPGAEAFAALQQEAKTHPQIKPCSQAISSTTGEADLFVTKSDVGSSLLKPLPGQPSQWLTPSHTARVRTTRLDDFIVSAKMPAIKLLKSDAKGLDLKVLQSAGTFLRPAFVHAVLVELNFRKFYDAQGTVPELLGELAERGYRLAWLYPHRDHDKWLWWADALFIPEG